MCMDMFSVLMLLFAQGISLDQGIELEASQAGGVKVVVEGAPAVRKKLKNPKPEYPEKALKDSVQGSVRIWFVVNKSGKVSKSRVDSSSGHKVLDKAALAAVKGWVFASANVVDTGYALFTYYIGSDLPQAGTIKTGGLQIGPPSLSDLSNEPTTAAAVTKITTKIRKKPSVKIKSKTKIKYPDEAKQAKESGTVTLRIRLKPKGEIAGIDVVSSSGSKALDQAGLDCVKNWKFYSKSEAAVEVDFLFELK